MLLGRAKGFAPWLAPTAMALAALATTGLLLARAKGVGSARTRGRIAMGAAALALVALLAGPAAYSIATVGKALDGGNPLAGPASAQAGLGGPGGAPGSGVGRGGFVPAGLPRGVTGPSPQTGGTPSGGTLTGTSVPGGVPPAGVRPGAAGGQASKALVSYLKANQGKAAYIVAAVGSSTAGSIAVQSGREAIDMGGFMGSDPAPSLAKLKSFIASGQLHYVLLSGNGGAPGNAGGLGSIGGPGGPGGGPGGGSSTADRTAVRARDAWIEAHGKVVHVSGASSGGATLYYFA